MGVESCRRRRRVLRIAVLSDSLSVLRGSEAAKSSGVFGQRDLKVEGFLARTKEKQRLRDDKKGLVIAAGPPIGLV